MSGYVGLDQFCQVKSG